MGLGEYSTVVNATGMATHPDFERAKEAQHFFVIYMYISWQPYKIFAHIGKVNCQK